MKNNILPDSFKESFEKEESFKNLMREQAVTEFVLFTFGSLDDFIIKGEKAHIKNSDYHLIKGRGDYLLIFHNTMSDRFNVNTPIQTKGDIYREIVRWENIEAGTSIKKPSFFSRLFNFSRV
jgi:hypothetical protein